MLPEQWQTSFSSNTEAHTHRRHSETSTERNGCDAKKAQLAGWRWRGPRGCEEATVTAQSRQDSDVGTRRASLHTCCSRFSAAGQRGKCVGAIPPRSTLGARRARPPSRHASSGRIATTQWFAEWGGLAGRRLGRGPRLLAGVQRAPPSLCEQVGVYLLWVWCVPSRCQRRALEVPEAAGGK